MQKINSFLATIVIYCLLSYLLRLPDLVLSLLFAVLGSQIDILLPRDYKHSLIILTVPLVLSIKYPIVFIPFSIGYASSTFIALLSKDGCKLLYPYKNTTFTGPANYLENGGKDEKAATCFLIVLATLAIIFSLYGTQIITDMNDYDGITNYFNNRANGTGGYTGSNARYGENNSGYIHQVQIDPATSGDNKNITSYNYNNSTTTIITDYTPPA